MDTLARSSLLTAEERLWKHIPAARLPFKDWGESHSILLNGFPEGAYVRGEISSLYLVPEPGTTALVCAAGSVPGRADTFEKKVNVLESPSVLPNAYAGMHFHHRLRDLWQWARLLTRSCL